MVGVSSLGVGSGIDLQSLVDGFVAAETQLRLGRLDVTEGAATERISAYGGLSSALSSFNSSLNELSSLSSFDERNVSISNEDAFDLSASLNAPLGTLDIEVIDPGTAQLLTGVGFVDVAGSALTNQTTDIGGGTLTIAQGAQGVFSVSIASNSSSLDDIAAAINSADDNTGVSASVIQGDAGTVLVLNASDTGTGNSITVTVDDVDGADDDTNGLSQLAFDGISSPRFTETIATNAQIRVSGQTITSTDGSSFSDVITGISITAKAATTQVESATITRTTSSALSAVEDFVAAYNEVAETIASLGRAGGENQEASGALVGDSVLRTLSSQLRRTIFTSITDGQPVGVQSLSDIGISVDRNGSLELDSATLSERLESQFQSVTRLLASSGESVALVQEFESIAYASLATQPGDLSFSFSQQLDDSEQSFAVDVSGLDLVAARDAINTAVDNFGVTASVILEDDSAGGTQARLIVASNVAGQSVDVSVIDNVSSNSVDIFSVISRANEVAPQGIIASLQSVVEGFLGGGTDTGVIAARTEGLNREIERIGDQRILQQRRIDDFEQRLIAQFSALDLLVSNLQSSGSFLLTQLNNISSISTGQSN